MDWNSIRPAAAKLGRFIGAAFVAYAFIVVLIAASMQASVADGLAKLTPTPLDYSSAYAMREKVPAADDDLKDKLKQRQAIQIEWAVANRDMQAFADGNAGLQAPLKELGRRLTGNPNCAFSLEGPNAISVAIALDRIAQCDDAPASTRRAIDLVLKNADAIRHGADAELQQKRIADNADTRGKLLDNDIKDARDARNALEPGRKGVEAMKVLDQPWIIWGERMAALPPSVTQIILSFVAGMFGALLLTLVLIVYPNIQLSEEQQSYGPRIMLGGLIALCVFVVLGGGTAVLGTASAFTRGEANYMAFCAICILAGMFSDRVAAWLSERAATFFKVGPNNAGGEAGGDGNG